MRSHLSSKLKSFSMQERLRGWLSNKTYESSLLLPYTSTTTSAHHKKIKCRRCFAGLSLWRGIIALQ